MIIDGLSSDEIKVRLKEFCNNIIKMADNLNRSSDEVYDAVLSSSDWLKALTKLGKRTKDPNVYSVVLIVKVIYEHTECISQSIQKALPEQEQHFAELAKEEAKKLLLKLDE